MIPNIRRGRRVGGLLRYLYGPGRREEHKDPHLVAAWDGAGDLATLEPEITASGKRDFRRLTELLEIPVRAGRNPPREYVWHCSLRTHPTDRELTDAQWAHMAGEVLARTGLAPHGDQRAVRWVAVRHGPDHIHIVATLVRQDRRSVWPRRDWPLAQAACRDLEERYGLYRIAPSGQASRRYPGPKEINKAARLGRKVPARDDLRRRVRAAAAQATNETDFFARLKHDRITVKLRHGSRDPNEVTGYAVALDTNVTAAGELIFYGGGRLAPDLTLPRLRTRWTGNDGLPPSAAQRAAAGFWAPTRLYQQAADITAQAAAAMAAATGPAEVAGIAQAAGDLLAAAARSWEGPAGGPLTRAAEVFDRATHESGPAGRRHDPAGYPLRAMARLISLIGVISSDQETAAALKLVHAMVALADTLADLRQAHERIHQIHAARDAAAQLRAYQPPAARARSATPLPARTQVAEPGTHPNLAHQRRIRR